MDRILVTEQIAEEGLAALRAGAQVDLRTDLDKVALFDVLPAYDALVVRSGTKVTAELLAAGERLRVEALHGRLVVLGGHRSASLSGHFRESWTLTMRVVLSQI